MKRHSYLRSYVTYRSGMMIAAVLMTIIYCIVFWLYQLPVEAVGYASLLAGVLAMILIIYDYSRYAAMMHHLQNLHLDTLQLPEAVSPLQQEYHQLITELLSRQQHILTDTKIKLQDLAEYYTLWAHQIKTPIAAMRLLLQEDTDQNHELQAELFKIEQYVQLILQYMKLESINQDFVFNQVNLDTVIRQSIRKYARLFIRKSIELNYEPCDTIVISDAKWLGFVIEQLLSNAIKYTSKQITIHVTADHVLKITDDGIGIREEDLPRIFEKGYTGYNGRTQQNATGIGLYLCTKILHKLSHTLSVQSKLNAGTTVCIDFKQEPAVFD